MQDYVTAYLPMTNGSTATLGIRLQAVTGTRQALRIDQYKHRWRIPTECLCDTTPSKEETRHVAALSCDECAIAFKYSKSSDCLGWTSIQTLELVLSELSSNQRRCSALVDVSSSYDVSIPWHPVSK